MRIPSVRLFLIAIVILSLSVGGCGSAEVVSPAVTGPGAGPTATQPAVAPTSVPTSALLVPSTTPTQQAATTASAETKEAVGKDYLVLFLLDLSTQYLDEAASLQAKGQLDAAQALAASLTLGVLQQSVEEALAEPPRVSAMEAAWAEAKLVLPVVRSVAADWANGDVSPEQMPTRLELARRQIASVMALAADAVASTAGISAEELEATRQEAAAEFRASLAATPTPATIAEATGATPSAAVSAEITDIRWRKGVLGDLEFFGEVQNTGQTDASGVKVTVTLLTAEGTVVSTDTGSALLSLLRPGELAPFRVSFFKDPGPFASFEAVVQAEPAGAYVLSSIHTTLELTRERVRESDKDTLSLVCEAVNSGALAANLVGAAVTAYNAGGQVVGVGSSFAEQSAVLPGEYATFNVDLDVVEPAATHSIEFDGRVADRPEPIALELVNLNRVVDYFGDPFYVGELLNSSDQAVTSASVIITIDASDGTLHASDSGRTYLDVIPPGARAAFRVSFWDDEDLPADGAIHTTLEGRYAEQYVLHSNYKQFELVEHNRQTAPADRLVVVGQVKNVGDCAAKYVEVIVTGYDAEGNVVVVDSTYTELDRLDLNGTSPFEIDAFAPRPVADYVIQVEGTADR